MQRFPLDANARSQRSNDDALKARIIAEARARGASDIRVAPAADETTRERLHASIARGDLATWPYDPSYAQRASDARTILADARSVVCIAVSYATEAPSRRPLEGRVSNYAWSPDYHRRMRVLLTELAQIIDDLAGAPVTAIACDTKPIAERAFAARSGLGWVGKHTNLISSAGSFVFLGEVVTSLDLPHDPPLRKTCGACTRCVAACPTNALRGDYTIDANRCIADLTQRTDPIPHDMRALIGEWVWGCDICQDVCPPTQRAGKRNDRTFAPLDDEVAAPPLTAMLRMRSGEFKRRYALTAMGWRGAAVLRRNAAIALGNALDRSAVGELRVAVQSDPHPMVRGACAWALGRIGSPGAIETLREALSTEKDESVLPEIRSALEPFGVSSPLGTT